MSEFLEKENRKKILILLSHNPGLHSSKIAELLNMKISEVEHHLQYFEKKGIIFVTKEAGYKRYYIEDSKVKTRDKRILETRGKIYSLIMRNPGLHLSKIAEKLDISIQLIDYHLRYLEKNGKILAVKDDRGYYKRYYIADSGIKGQEKKILEILRKKIPLKIVVLLLKLPHLKHKEIMKHLDISASRLSYHLAILANNGIVNVIPHGREKGYTLNSRDEIVKILKKYELYIELHLTIDSFMDLWEDFNY